MSHLIIIIISVLLLVLLLALTSAETYYVSPTTSTYTPCVEESVPCFNLTQYATKPNNYFASNTSLVLLPGNHSLDLEFELENRTIFTITTSNHSDTSIICSQSAVFTLNNISMVSMRGLVLIGCINNNITSVEQFTLTDCSLQGQGHNGTGLELNWVKRAKISRSSFFSYTGREISDPHETFRAGGSIIIRSSTLTILSSTFSNNTVKDTDNGSAAGGAVYADGSSKITANSTTFKNNTINGDCGWGGAVYVDVASEITINNCIFNSNSVNGDCGSGGAVCAVGSSKITVNNTTFNNNSVNGKHKNGGAVYAYKSSEITITNATFNNNTVNGDRGEGGAMFASSSNITAHNTVFNNNAVNGNDTEGFGGAVCACRSSKVIVNNTIFNNNNVAGDFGYGGAVYIKGSSEITINNATFNNNGLSGDYGWGGVMYAQMSIIIVKDTTFTNNSVTGNSGSGGVVYAVSSDVTLYKSIFNNNIVSGDSGSGGAVYAGSSNITTYDTVFINNSVAGNNGAGGAVYGASSLNITVNNSTFTNNSVTEDQGKGGALYVYSSNITLTNAIFNNSSVTGDNGKGGAVYVSLGSTFNVSNTAFTNSTANEYGGAVFAVSSNVIMNGFIDLQKNMADVGGVMNAIHSTVYVAGNITISNNCGSLYAYASNVTFVGSINVMNNSNSTNISEEGGALTAIQSEITFTGTAKLSYNRAIHGGAISATQSKFHVYGNVTIIHNTACLSGGGIYAIQSELNFGSYINISDNSAVERGGGIHLINSITRMTDDSKTYFIDNHAKKGGGACLEMNAKLFLLKDQIEHGESDKTWIRLEFTENSADYGGALYVTDDTNSGVCQHAKPFSTESECFIQGLTYAFANLKDLEISRNTNINVRNTYFTNNSASEAGDVIYGGLLDRCTISPYAGYFLKSSNASALSYILYISDLNSSLDSTYTTKVISSDPVRVCFCRDRDRQPDCSYHPQLVNVHKGETFTVSLAALDQVYNTISNSDIISYLSAEAGLGDGQSIQTTGEGCTELHYTVTSPRTAEQLHLYANYTCKDIGASLQTVDITFTTCPIGFNESNSRCDCDPELSLYITNCSIDTRSVVRRGNVWIKFMDVSGNKSVATYPNCPFDYCYPSTEQIQINVEIPEEADKQCAFNRSGMLCGSCMDGLSLSLGSSRCMPCSNKWLALLPVFVIAGIALVAFLLVCNLTVAAGTINGLLFYANIVSSNQATFPPNSIPIFIAWLNLDFGFETCFFNGLNGYWKTWLQLAFPAYVIFLVILVIKACKYSYRFARLIARKNPVATLDTLVLLSYTKFIRIIISAWQFANLAHSDGKCEMVWLVDGNIKYFESKHIPLFIVALLILVISTVYTALLFCWQWLLLCPNRKPVRWIRNSRLHGIMDAYFITFNKNHRYWTGLLLLARVILYLVSALNGVVTTDPRVNFASIICVVGSLLLWKEVIKGKIYRKWLLDILDTSFLFNLLILTVATWYVREEGGNQTAVINTSVSIALFTFILIISYHVYAFAIPNLVEKIKAKFFKCLKGSKSQSWAQQVQNVESGINNYDMPVSVTVVEKPEIPVDGYDTNEDDANNDYDYSSKTTEVEEIELEVFASDKRPGIDNSGLMSISKYPKGEERAEESDESDYDELAPLLISYDKD